MKNKQHFTANSYTAKVDLTSQKNENPSISIVTVVKNDLDALQLTFESVRMQKNKDYEYIVIDGGSSDRTQSWLNSLTNPPDFFISEDDDGIYDAMNKGLKCCRGHWVHFLNAGDTYVDENVLDYILNNIDQNLDIIITDIMRMDEGGQTVWKQKAPLHFGIFNNVCHQAIWYNIKYREIHFDTDFKISADCHLLMKLVFSHKSLAYLYVPKVCTNYKMGGLSQIEAKQALEERKQSFDCWMKNPMIKMINRLNLSRQQFKLWWRHCSSNSSQ